MQYLVSPERFKKVIHEANTYPSIALNGHQLCDLELLLNGGFAPLTGYLNLEDYHSVCRTMHLADGTFWPWPITLDVTREAAGRLKPGDRVTLRDHEEFILAFLTIEDRWEPDRTWEAEMLLGHADKSHPAVNRLLNHKGPVSLGGRLMGIALPKHYDYQMLRPTPRELQKKFMKRGWDKVAAYMARGPMHQAEVAMALRAAQEAEANILIHPAVDGAGGRDMAHYTRVRCYEKVVKRFPRGTVMLSLLPFSTRQDGPRETLLAALINRNYGCTHFIIEKDQAGPRKLREQDSSCRPWASYELALAHRLELGIEPVKAREMVYLETRAEYKPADEIEEGGKVLGLSKSELARRLDKGLEIPHWFSYGEVIEELKRIRPPLNKRGFIVFFTGLSGSGKTTLAHGLRSRLMEYGRRPLTLLDGDVIRDHLSGELGFSKADRSINVRRVGFVAGEIVRNGGVAVCAMIAPYREDRRAIRKRISKYGGFILIHVNTPLEKCEERDMKGMYAKARQGAIKNFTGISDPYEPPEYADIVIDSSCTDPEVLVQDIILKIEQLGYL